MKEQAISPNQTDVIVIGAGPAGCAAAIRARQAGLRVILLESNPEPKVAPGETLHPGIEPILKQLGILDRVADAGFRRHRGIWSECRSQREFLPYGEGNDGAWRGLQVDRQAFHSILQQGAVDAGATLIRNSRPEAVIVEGGRVNGVTVKGSVFRGHWTVDATGRTAWLARVLDLPADLRSPPLGVRFGWRDGEALALDGQPAFAFRDDGWDWQAPLADGRSAWVELRIDKPNDRRPKGMDFTWRIHHNCAGPGYILIGDAAAMLDPASSHGVLKALMSGILFGHLAEAFQEKRVSEAFVRAAYRSWIIEQFEHDEICLRQLYAGSPAGQYFSSSGGRRLFQWRRSQ